MYINFKLSREASRKFGREVAKFGRLLSEQRDFSIESMLYQLSQCAFSNFLESYIS